MALQKVLHTARASSRGGRNGHTQNSDGLVSVDHEIVVTGLSQADAEKIVAAGHQMCPYSKAVRGNIEVTVKTVVA